MKIKTVDLTNCEEVRVVDDYIEHGHPYFQVLLRGERIWCRYVATDEDDYVLTLKVEQIGVSFEFGTLLLLDLSQLEVEL